MRFADLSPPAPSQADSLRLRLRPALHSLSAAPTGPGWNAAELADLLPHGDALAAAAVLVPIVTGETASIILTRRTDRLTHHAGQVSFPGGRIEISDLSVVDAALRESHEEIGLAHDLVEPLGFLDPFVTITGFRVIPVVGLVDPSAALVLDPNEVAETFEVPLAFVLDPANLQQREGEYRGRCRRYHVFEYGTHVIWGATASMLVNLVSRLRAVETPR